MVFHLVVATSGVGNVTSSLARTAPTELFPITGDLTKKNLDATFYITLFLLSKTILHSIRKVVYIFIYKLFITLILENIAKKGKIK